MKKTADLQLWTNEELLEAMAKLKRPGARLKYRDAIFNKNRGMVFAELEKSHLTPEVRQDISQELLMVLTQAIEYFDLARGVKFSTYLHVALHNRHKTCLSKLNEGPEPYSLALAAENLIDYNKKSDSFEIRKKIVELFQRNPATLPPRQIRIIRALYIDEPTLTFGEVAEKFRMKPDSVRRVAALGLAGLKEFNRD